MEHFSGWSTARSHCRFSQNQHWILWQKFCYIDRDIFSTFLGHEKLWFFNFRPWMGATLCEPDLRNMLPSTLYNDFYRQLRCRRCASNLLFWPWHFLDLSKRSRKTLIFQLQTLDGFHFVWPNLWNFLPFTSDNDFYRQLRCRKCASNLLFWPWHFSELAKRSQKTLSFQINTFDGCHFVGTRSQKLFGIYLR